MDITQLNDDLKGDWWHYIRVKDFGFIYSIPNLKNLTVNDGDILLHKEIKEGERFPTKRYHLIHDKGSKIVENNEVKEILTDKLVDYVKKNKALPFSCKRVKFFKNGNVQVNYSPTQYDNFALKIIPKEHEIEDITKFFEGLESVSNPITPTEKAKQTLSSKNRWTIPSSSDETKQYIVSKNKDGTFSCTCPHHIFRKAECKHIKKVKESLS
jgi:hypothetical protein